MKFALEAADRPRRQTDLRVQLNAAVGLQFAHCVHVVPMQDPALPLGVCNETNAAFARAIDVTQRERGLLAAFSSRRRV